MSIATDEALRRWPETDTSTGGPISQSYAERYEMRREGFVAGAEWQASREPTEAEIEAADEALLQAYRENSNMLTNREAVHIVLDAARKAVTGDE